MNKKQIELIFTLMLAIIGYGILVYVNWKIALGVFFVNWYINMSAKVKSK